MTDPRPGDVLRLDHYTAGIAPGLYVVVHIEDAAAVLAPVVMVNGEPTPGERLIRTNVYNLSFFRPTGFRLEMATGRKRKSPMRRPKSIRDGCLASIATAG